MDFDKTLFICFATTGLIVGTILSSFAIISNKQFNYCMEKTGGSDLCSKHYSVRRD